MKSFNFHHMIRCIVVSVLCIAARHLCETEAIDMDVAILASTILTIAASDIMWLLYLSRKDNEVQPKPKSTDLENEITEEVCGLIQSDPAGWKRIRSDEVLVSFIYLHEKTGLYVSKKETIMPSSSYYRISNGKVHCDIKRYKLCGMLDSAIEIMGASSVLSSLEEKQ